MGRCASSVEPVSGLLRAQRSTRAQRYRRARGRPSATAGLRLAQLGAGRSTADPEPRPGVMKGWVPSVDLDAILDDLRSRSRHRPETGVVPESVDQGELAVSPRGLRPGRGRWRLGRGRWRSGHGRWRGARLDPGRRGAHAMAIGAGLAAALTVAWVLFGAPSAGVTRIDTVSQFEAAPMSSVASGSASVGARPGPSAQVVVVDVAGSVTQPGVYSLAAGSRVADALAAAGGALPGIDLSSLNLARVLVDGEQIPVGVAGDRNSAGGSVGATGAGTGAPIDLNRATAQILDELPGVGPVLAQNILQWRTEHGRFDSVDQLREVSGIGEAKYAQLKARVRV